VLAAPWSVDCLSSKDRRMTTHTTVDDAAPAAGRLSRSIDYMAIGILLAAVVVPLVVIFANVVLRSAFSIPLLWTDEVAKVSLASLAFIGGAVAYRRGHHAHIRLFI